MNSTVSVTESRSSSRWKKALDWVRTLEQAIDYDPLDHTNSTVKRLRQSVLQLEARVNELEGGDQPKR